MEDKRYDKLRASFEAKQPQLPADFTKQVMKRIEARPAKSYWRWVAAVACLFIIIGMGIAMWPTGDADEAELLAQPFPALVEEGSGVASATSTLQIITPKKQTKRILTPPLPPPLQERGRAAHSEPRENVSTPELTAETTHTPETPNLEMNEAANIVPPERQALADIYLAEAALQVAYRRQAQAEALRTYAISFEEEEATPAQPTIAF